MYMYIFVCLYSDRQQVFRSSRSKASKSGCVYKGS